MNKIYSVSKTKSKYLSLFYITLHPSVSSPTPLLMSAENCHIKKRLALIVGWEYQHQYPLILSEKYLLPKSADLY